MKKTAKANLPPRHYHRLNTAAEHLDCTVDDLLHWGANGYISLCLKPALVCDEATYEPCAFGNDVPTIAWTGIPGHEVGVFTEGPNKQGYELLGLWALSMTCISKLEQHGTIEGAVFLMLADLDTYDPDAGYMADSLGVWAKLKAPIYPEDLCITQGELEEIQKGSRKSRIEQPGNSLHQDRQAHVPPKTHDFYHRLIAWLGSKAGAIKQQNQASIENLTALETDWKKRGFSFDRDRVSAVLRGASEKLPSSSE